MTLGAWKPFSKVQALFLSLLGYLHDEETRLVIGRPTGRVKQERLGKRDP